GAAGRGPRRGLSWTQPTRLAQPTLGESTLGEPTLGQPILWQQRRTDQHRRADCFGSRRQQRHTARRSVKLYLITDVRTLHSPLHVAASQLERTTRSALLPLAVAAAPGGPGGPSAP